MSADVSARDVLLARTQIRNPKKLKTYLELAARDGADCGWCGKEADLTIDHRVSGAGDDLSNLQLLCATCNSEKGSKTEDKTVRWASSVFQGGFTMIPNVVILDSAIGPHAQRLYALLLHYARQDEDCWPGQEGLAATAGISERSIRSAVRELEEAKLVRTRRRGRGQTNVYVLLLPKAGDKPGEGVDEEKPRAARPAAQERQTVPLLGDLDAIEKKGIDTLDVVALREAWGKLAPPLPSHRSAYYTKPKVRTAIRNALKVYPSLDVVAAMKNYAAVLASPDHFWTHRWTFQEFLDRGLDKFVAEADPLSNFRVRRDADANGGRQRTPVEQLSSAEAWILATAWRLPLDEHEVAELLGKRGVEGRDRTRLLDLWRSKQAA